MRVTCHGTSWVVVVQKPRYRLARCSSRDVADAIIRRRGTGRHSRRAFEAGTAPSKLLHARHATDATPGIRGAPGPLGDARGARKAKSRHSATGGGATASAERARWEDTVHQALDAGCTPQHSLGTASERPDGPEAHVSVRWIVSISPELDSPCPGLLGCYNRQ